MRMPLTSSTRADVKSVVFSFHGCRILFIIGSNCFQDRCAVCHIFCHRSDLIQRRTIGDQSVTGNGSVRRFDTGYSTERTRLTDGSAGIRTKGIRNTPLLPQLRRNRRKILPERARYSMDFLSRRKQKSLWYFPWQIHPYLFFQ